MRYTEYNNFSTEFVDPVRDGIVIFDNFIPGLVLDELQQEIADDSRVAWRDNHNTFVNQRGLTVVQNHDAYALKLSRGYTEGFIDRIPEVIKTVESIQNFVQKLGYIFPSLIGWKADEMSLHRYDDDLGLSRHKDNARFVGVIAIAAIEGECDLEITGHDGSQTYPTNPGDLVLLRAPKLIDTQEDLRPEHAVVNLRTPTRTSLMIRANDRPDEAIPGFIFENWTPYNL